MRGRGSHVSIKGGPDPKAMGLFDVMKYHRAGYGCTLIDEGAGLGEGSIPSVPVSHAAAVRREQ